MYKKADGIPQEVADWLDNGDLTDMPFAVMEHIGFDLSAEEMLTERGLTREEALKKADEDEKEFRGLLEACGITETRLAPMWIKLVALCREQLTEERLALLLRLISGYEPTEIFSEMEEDDIIARWLSKTEHLYNYIGEINMRKRNTDRWLSVLFQAEKSRNNIKDIKSDNRFIRVFNMLCSKGYTGTVGNTEILRENLRNIAELIEGNPFLKAVEPLVYFRAFEKQSNRMLTKEDYIPNIRNIFNRTEYLSAKPDYDKEPNEYTVNEKHNLRAYHCKLYIDIMECFPKADRELCDEGFLRCSDLSDWYYVYTEGGEKIPLSICGFVMNSLVRCIDPESSYEGSANASWEQVYEYERELDMQGKGVLDKHARRILKAIDGIKFDDLERYISDGAAFFNEIWSGYSKNVKPQNYDVEQTILAQSIDSRFLELLVQEICGILELYLVSEDKLI
ncbi:MAG: hypothetical protein K2O14_04235 [Oscillospiraceae bacterium]|nr:hypothetical protein [Oscillospiraceae bacterium]